jgi:L-alanine-DL-glutamate epimerase-like enolase superfamily enzyme
MGASIGAAQSEIKDNAAQDGQLAWQAINFLGHAGEAVMALSALDTACWDLGPQGAGLPLHRLLGAVTDRVPTYASSGLWLDYTVDELVAEARRVLAFHTPVSSHLFPEVSSHLIAAAPNGLMLEHITWWEALFEEPLQLVDGAVLLPQRPGIGLRLRPEPLTRFRV